MESTGQNRMRDGGVHRHFGAALTSTPPPRSAVVVTYTSSCARCCAANTTSDDFEWRGTTLQPIDLAQS